MQVKGSRYLVQLVEVRQAGADTTVIKKTMDGFHLRRKANSENSKNLLWHGGVQRKYTILSSENQATDGLVIFF